MAKTKEELREARKQWFHDMEQKLKELHTQEDDSLKTCGQLSPQGFEKSLLLKH